MENNNTQTYEAKDVLKLAVRELACISIPAALMEMPPEFIMAFKQQVINPIAAAKANLVECIKAIDREEAQQKDRQRAEEQEKQKALAGEAGKPEKDEDAAEAVQKEKVIQMPARAEE